MNCKGKCSLEYTHEGEHKCEAVHKCAKFCDYKDISKGCKQKCNLNYGHEGKHSCGEVHYSKEKCILINISDRCLGDCINEYGHEGKSHLCKKIEEHFCKGECEFKNRSFNCKKNVH